VERVAATHCLDAGAVIAYLRQEPGAEVESIKNLGVIPQSGVERATPPVSARLADGSHEDQSPTRGVR
jgi:hypothetical protein